MRNALLRVTGLGLVASIALAGCGGGDDPVEKPTKEPVFDPGQGQSPSASIAYPSGAKGVNKGSIIANYQFVGFANKSTNTDGLLQPIQLADFYNPTGDGVYPEPPEGVDPETMTYPPGQAKPKALLIDVASVWCQPCNDEAHYVLPGLHDKYAPQGGEFLLQLADSSTPGEPATTTNLINWTTKYKVNYPATVDPTYKLGSLFDADAFPANMIIDTRTMEIVDVIAGVPEEGGSFWMTYEKVLAGTN